MEKGEFKFFSFFKDDKGIIWVGGRFDKVIVLYEEKYLVLFFSEYKILLLIIEYMYCLGYIGVVIIIVKIRRKYWILRGNKFSKFVKFKCVYCKEMVYKVEM